MIKCDHNRAIYLHKKLLRFHPSLLLLIVFNSVACFFYEHILCYLLCSLFLFMWHFVCCCLGQGSLVKEILNTNLNIPGKIKVPK